MMNEVISKGSYFQTKDAILLDLINYLQFTYYNFKNNHITIRRLTAKLCITAKTHTFKLLDDMIIENDALYQQQTKQALQPIILQQKFKDCLTFPEKMLKDDREYVSSEVDQLFIVIPLKETIFHINQKNDILPTLRKLFKHLLYELHKFN